jgi:hypothetical protein
MAEGVEAVKHRLSADFGGLEFRDRRDKSADWTVISFEYKGATYVVTVSDEYDGDYASGTTMGLSDLTVILKSSRSRRVSVTTKRIFEV